MNNKDNFNLSPEEIKYQEALKRVKKIKGFYSHLMVFIVINTMIIVVNTSNSSEPFWRWQNFTTAFFWGIGLLAHGLSVFLPTMMLGKNWEERKIKELMDKEKNNKWI
ncbi:2TM domain-containing protein [Flavobacterium sp.]